MGILLEMKDIFTNWYCGGMRFTPGAKRKLQDFLGHLIQALPEPDGDKLEMTYDAAIKYFVTYKPYNRNIKKGAILRQQLPEGIRIVQVFLDERNMLVYSPTGNVYGRQVVVKGIDQELNDAFSDTDLIIVD